MGKIKTLNDVCSSLVNSYTTVPYVSEYRPSNLPFCEVDQYLTLIKNNWKNKTSFAKITNSYMKQTWAGELYTSMGTQIHTITQKYLARLGILLGDYKCLKCDLIQEQTQQHICPICKTEMIYEELGFKKGDNHIKGHTDGILMLNKTWLMDIKTTTTYKLKNFKIPYNYLLQGSIYLNKLKEQRGISCDGICFLMIPRNNVKAAQFILFSNTTLLTTMYKGVTKNYNEVYEKFKEGNFDVTRLYKNKEECLSQYTPCPYASFCWKNNYKEILQDIKEKGKLNV